MIYHQSSSHLTLAPVHQNINKQNQEMLYTAALKFTTDQKDLSLYLIGAEIPKFFQDMIEKQGCEYY